MGKVEGYTSRTDVGGVQTHSGNMLVDLHELFALFKERGETTNVHDVCENGHEMVRNTCYFAKGNSDPLGMGGRLDVLPLASSRARSSLQWS